MEPIEWHRGLADSPVARFLAYAVVGIGIALPALAVLLATVLAVVSIPAIVGSLSADPSTLLVIVVLVLVGGPMSLLYLWPLLTEPDQRRPILANTWIDALETRGIVLATIGGATVHVLAFLVVPVGPLLVLLGGGLLASTGTWLLLTEGAVNPRDRTLTVRSSQQRRVRSGDTVDLDTWTGLTRYRLGPVTLLRPSYGPGVRGGTPRLLSLPSWVAEAASPVFEQALETPVPTPERPPNPVVAATLALFGLGIVAVGVAALALEVGPASYRAYLLVFGLVVGGLFLVLARREY